MVQVIKVYECVLCKRKRKVKEFPVSECMCRTDFPNRHMTKLIYHFFRWIVADFFIFIWESIQIKISRDSRDGWKHIDVKYWSDRGRR